jgi:indole-3-glycerol phosphate synthase/phosphoribosylanthranilate isomerase
MNAPFTTSELQLAIARLYGDHPATHLYGASDPNHELSTLQTITATVFLDYAKKQKAAGSDGIKTIDELQAQFNEYKSLNGPPLSLADVIISKQPAMCLAAEFKRASPSKGLIAANLDSAEQGVKYANAGAGVISVLTEERWFKGGLDDLRGIREATQKSGADRPAILRKDFVTTKYQILEAAANGADSILLIVAVLPLGLLKELIDYARNLGMEPLVEVHALCELDVALESGAKVVGVNNRNLHTMKLDLAQTEKVANAITDKGVKLGQDVILCALSGMSNAHDVDRYRNQKVQMCLIGESLMRAADPAEAIKGLCLHPDDYASQKRGGGAYTHGLKIVKICGLTNVEDALAACRAGANLLGVIFAEKSKRKVGVDGARQIVEAVRKFGERSDRVSIEVESNGTALSSLVEKSMALEQASRRPLVVGVFQNQPLEYVKQMVDECGLDMVQLHGQEGMEAANAKNFGVPALRVVDIESGGNGEQRKGSELAEDILSKVTADPLAILLDTSIKGAKEGGGTGVTFDWSIAESLQSLGLPVIIAGGLTPDNVGEAVASVRPWGIDVAGGVEAGPGKKDLKKVEKFVSGARSAAVEANKGF